MNEYLRSLQSLIKTDPAITSLAIGSTVLATRKPAYGVATFFLTYGALLTANSIARNVVLHKLR